MNGTEVKELFASVAADPAADRIDMDAVLRGGRRRHRTRVAATLGASAAALTLVGALLSGVLPASSPDPVGPTPTGTASPSPALGQARIAVTPNQAQQELPAARAAWAARPAATGDYRLTVRRASQAAPVRADSEVSGGEVASYDVFTDPRKPGSVPEQLPDAAGAGLPRTVPELLDLVASYADAAGLTVVFDRFGVPVRIDVDPNAGAVDDEMTLTVAWSRPGDLDVPDGPGPWTLIPRTDPFPTDGLRDGIYTGSRAVVASDGRGVGIYLTLWGSSSCPAQPTTLTFVEPSEPRLGQTEVAAEVLVGSDQPDTQPCSADLSGTTYWAPLPSSYAAKLPASPPALGGPSALTHLELVLTGGAGSSSVAAGGLLTSRATS